MYYKDLAKSLEKHQNLFHIISIQYDVMSFIHCRIPRVVIKVSFLF